MNITKNLFGKIENNDIYLFELRNEFLKVEIINYEAIIKSIYFNNKNVVLGFNSLEDYIKDYLYTGCFVGRNAGRIKNASFIIDNESYYLEKNDNNNNLHSGIYCFNKYVFNYKIISQSEMELSLNINHKEDLFPGNLEILITYKLVENKLNINIQGRTENKTIFNPTYHTYFNLNGDSKEDILNHELKINSDFLLCIDEHSIPNGNINKTNIPFNFNTGKLIKEDINNNILKHQKGFDHPFILRNSQINAILKSKKSNIQMNLYTDLPSLIFYSGNFIPKNYYKTNSVERCGLCLEPQFYPDFLNNNFNNFLLTKDKIYNHNISYEFKHL